MGRPAAMTVKLELVYGLSSCYHGEDGTSLLID